MYVTRIGIHSIAFRDHYSIGLEPSSIEFPEIANLTIDNIFNISEVLMIKPAVVTYYAVGGVVQGIQLDVEVYPVKHKEECDRLSRIFRSIPDVAWVTPTICPATDDEVTEHVYGGIRSKK